MTTMKNLLIVILVFTFLGCQMETKEKRIQEEIKNLDYREVSMKIDFGDDAEVHKYEEYVSGMDDRLKFRVADKLINNEGGKEVIRYELTEIDTKTELCVKHFAAFLSESDTAEYYSKDTLMEKVESRSFFIDKKEYFVYKIQEVDNFMGSCNTSIISPDFGFIFGKGSAGDFEISQHAGNKILDELIHIVKQDSVFINCSQHLLDISNNNTNHHHFHGH